MKFISTALLAAFIAIGLSMQTQAKEGKFNSSVSIGEQAPDFSDLPGIDNKKHSLNDYKKAKAAVVVFTCNHCPVAQAYEERLVELQKAYKKRGVQFVAICANEEDADTLEKLKERAEEKKFNFSYLHDVGQKTGKAYGAAVTPHVFLLNGERKIVYMGSVDDNQMPDKVKNHYLRDAIDAILAGRASATTETRQFGCGIRYGG
jgi:peroxiredoxin